MTDSRLRTMDDGHRAPGGGARLHMYATTELAPCPYLEGREERRLVTRLEASDPPYRHDDLVHAGFRRSQGFAYRPACPSCTACVPVRIPAQDFRWSRTFRKIRNRNADLTISINPPVATEEGFELFRRYLGSRHADGGMADMTREDYRDLVETTPVKTRLVEFRDPNGTLIAVSLTDEVMSGLSGVYKFYEPEADHRSLGTYTVLWHVMHAVQIDKPYVYLGYWIKACRKMTYKARFQPLEALFKGRWHRMEQSAGDDTD
ncbi:MAG: arginyltransferase [Geminicoccaceae bacterium]